MLGKFLALLSPSACSSWNWHLLAILETGSVVFCGSAVYAGVHEEILQQCCPSLLGLVKQRFTSKEAKVP